MSGTQIGSMIICLLGIVLSLGGLGYSIYQSVLLVKDKRASFDIRPYLKKIVIGIAVFVIALTGGLPSVYPWNNLGPTMGQYLYMFFGGLFFTASIGLGINSFIIHYYGKEFSKAFDKMLFIILMASIPLSIISFFVYTNGFTGMLGDNYILPNGIDFASYVWHFPTSNGKPNIAFYAICILSGALFVYFLCDHYMYKEYGKHGTLETTFFSAFPAGILGARIAYVIGNWTKEGFNERVAHGEWWSIFAVWEGGLTILGGAIAGILVGVFVYIKTQKGRSIWRAMDLIIPTILLAQAIGRWGNFFNCEVHGGLVPISEWSWLPNVVVANARYSSVDSLRFAPEGYIYLPLFFIEFITNILGYFVIAHLFGIRFKKILAPGDLAGAYLIWYGYTRIFLEPLRHPSFKMGENDYWSWFWALMFVVGGTLYIAINHLVRYLKKNKETASLSLPKKTNNIAVVVLGVIGLALSVTGIILMATNPFIAELEFHLFNIGIILLASGVSFLFLEGVVLFENIYFYRHQKGVLSE